LLDKMSEGLPINEIIVSLTKSNTLSAATIASLGQEKRLTLLRMIRIAREQGGFLTGVNSTKTAFFQDFLVAIQRSLIDGFKVTDIITLPNGTTVSRTLTYDIAQKSFIFNGFDKAKRRTVSNIPISPDDAKKIFGTGQVDFVVDIMNGVIPSATGEKFKILDAFKAFQEASLVKAEDALIGMLANPTRAYLSADLGAGIADASKFQVGLDAIPNQANSLGRLAEKTQGLFGKYSIGPDGAALFKAITFVERNIIGGPVRGAARTVRGALDGQGYLADIADAIATNGIYSYFLGFILFNAGLALGPDIASTASKEDSVLGQTLAALSSGLNTSPLVPALVNCIIDVCGKVFDTVVGASDENIQALFNADVLLSAGDNLANALLVFGQLLDARAENFPALLLDATGAIAGAKQVADMAAEVIVQGTTALSSNQEAAANAAAQKVVTGVSGIAELSGGGATTGNGVWAALEQSRTATGKLTVDAVKATKAGLGGDKIPSISLYSKTMTFDYGTITAGDDTWLQIGNALTRIATGRNLPVSMETWAWLKINASRQGIGPSGGSDFASYLDARGVAIKANSSTIAIVNAEYARLAVLLQPAVPEAAPSAAP